VLGGGAFGSLRVACLPIELTISVEQGNDEVHLLDRRLPDFNRGFRHIIVPDLGSMPLL
jgi:hypothetical protein